MKIDNLVTGGSKDLLRAALQRERQRLEDRIEQRKILEARAAAKEGKKAKRGSDEQPQGQEETSTASPATATTKGTPEAAEGRKSWASEKASRFGGASFRSDLGIGEK